ncbi:MAG: hypothetical protein ABEN55_22145 [Bradymonadaceae bacterium]
MRRPTVVDSDVETATTWGDGCYEVDGRIDIEARLRIEPGTVVRFRENAGLNVRDSGMLVADGSSDARITFTGTEANRGWWRSLAFAGSDRQNVLDHVTIEYAGRRHQGTRQRHGLEPAGLTVGQRGDVAEMSVTNSIFRNNDGWGVYVHQDSSVNSDICSANSFDSNTNHCKVKQD